ncbi:hypothetical protein [Microbulbifer sp. A4B17]
MGFSFINTTEGSKDTNHLFSNQYNGAPKIGRIRGGYHFVS